MTTIKLSNISPNFRQTAWNYYAAVPPATLKDTYGKVAGMGKSFPAAVIDGELFVKSDLAPGEDFTGEFISDPTTPIPPFRMSNWVNDDISKLIPTFKIKDTSGNDYDSIPLLFWNGVGVEPDAYMRIISQNAVRMRVEVKTIIPKVPIHIHGYIDIYSEQDYVPYVFNFQYGNVSEGEFEAKFDSLRMFTGEKPHVDWALRKGLHQPMYRANLGLWEAELVSPRKWRKSRTIEVYGALLCVLNYADFATLMADADYSDRLNNLQARCEGPICAFVDAWEGHNLAFGCTPQKNMQASTDDLIMMHNMYEAFNTASDEYAPRPYAQPPNSGQTGAQPDFGASRLQAVMTNKNAWAIWEYRFNAQAWKLRPYAHREKNGTRVLADNHPFAKNYNMRPDERFNQGDRLGWNPPIPYFEDWTGSDNQHRSDNLLFGLYQITKDPSLKETILDIIENQKMEIDPTTIAPTGPVGSPRGWGRPLISMAHLYTLGFKEVLPIINKHVEYLYKYASLRNIPQTSSNSVRVLFDQGSKYGWVDAQGNPIRAWICWEESIAVMGLWAVWKATGNVKAMELAVDVARTITKHAFFKNTDGKWYSAYCVRWDGNSPGKPLPDSCYNLNPINQDVYVYGIHDWLIPSLKILINAVPALDPDIARAKDIVEYFGAIPKNLEQSAWWAVV